MTRETDPRVNLGDSMRLGVRRELGRWTSVPISLLAVLLPWAVCAKLDSQTNTLSPLSNLQGPTQSAAGPGNPASQDSAPAQAPPQSSNWAQSPSLNPAALSGSPKAPHHRLNTGPGASAKSGPSSLCFQPGVGWMQRPADVQQAGSSFQSPPISMLAGAAGPRRLAQAVDSNDCAPSTGSSASPNTGEPSPANTTVLHSAQAQGAASRLLSTLDSQPGSLLSGASAAKQGPPAQSLGSVVAPGQGESSSLFSARSPQGPGRIVPSVTSQGYVRFSLSSPGLAAFEAPDASAAPLISVPVYSFAPGQDKGATQSMMGEQTNQVSASTLERERNRVVGEESAGLKAQESSATAEIQISGTNIHEYRQLKNFCIKVVQAEGSGKPIGAASDLSSMGLSRGHEVTELLRLGGSCELFLALGRDAAIQKMQKHKGLK